MRLLYRGAPESYIATIVNAILLALIQRQQIEPYIILSWLVYILLVTAGRTLLVYKYRQSETQSEHALEWNRRYAIGSALAGIGWGAAEAKGGRAQGERIAPLLCPTPVHFDMFYPPYDSWFEHHVYPLPESSPFFRDVTARKEAERKIQQLNESCRPRDRELEESKLLFGKMKALKISMTP